MSSLRVMTSVLPSLSPSPGGETDKTGSNTNAAFTGVLDRVATGSTVADPKSSKESVGLGSSAKRTRSDAGASGSDEPDAEPVEDSLPVPTTALAGTPTLDISALAQAALIPTGSAVPPMPKTPTAGTSASSEAGLGTAPIASTTTALQAIIQQPGRPTSSQVGTNQSVRSIPSPATAIGAQAIPQPTTAVAPMTDGSTASTITASQAITQQPAQPRSFQVGTNQSMGSIPSPATAIDTRVSPQPTAAVISLAGTSTGPDAQAQSELPSSSATTASNPAGAVPTPIANGSTAVASAAKSAGAASSIVAPTTSGMAPGATASTVSSQQTTEADTVRRDDGAPQSSQASTEAAQAAAVVTAPPLLQTAATLSTPAPAPAAVRSTGQSGTRPTGVRPVSAGADGSVKSSLSESTATPSLSSLDGASGKRGKDKTPATPVVANASNDLPIVATPAQQILTALQSLDKDVKSATRSSAASMAAPADVNTPQTTGPSSLKTLTINLNPANLGQVSITMRLQADTMNIRIAVSNPDTLHLLDKDKHLLAAAVEAMGGSHENLQVGTLAQMSGSGDPASAGSQNQNTPGRQDTSSSDTSSNGRQSQGQNRSTLQDTSQSDADEPTSTSPLLQARRLDGSLYL